MDYTPRKRPEMLEITSFDDAARVMYRGSRGIEIHRIPKPWTIAHENGQKCLKSRDKTMPLESCTGGHGASKSSWDPKNMYCSPRKRPEMLKITSFDDTARVVYRGSRGIEILPYLKTVDYTPRKRPEMLEITSFDDAARVMFRGSRGIEIGRAHV